jgi:hypothetical protein
MIWSMIAFSTQAAQADGGAKPRFTVASLHGNYGGYVIATGGGDVGGIGVFTFDGAGNVSGKTTWNVGGQMGEFDILGTYDVNRDGTVDAVSEQTGATAGEFVGVITRSRKVGGTRLALDVAFIAEGLGPKGTVITFLITRQSEKPATGRDDDD